MIITYLCAGQRSRDLSLHRWWGTGVIFEGNPRQAVYLWWPRLGEATFKMETLCVQADGIHVHTLNTESGLARKLEALGLEWNDACLPFNSDQVLGIAIPAYTMSRCTHLTCRLATSCSSGRCMRLQSGDTRLFCTCVYVRSAS